MSTLREEADKLVVVWRNNSGVSISRKCAFNDCAGDLDRILAAHPEPEPGADVGKLATDLVVEMSRTLRLETELKAERALCDRLAEACRDIACNRACCAEGRSAVAAYDKSRGK